MEVALVVVVVPYQPLGVAVEEGGHLHVVFDDDSKLVGISRPPRLDPLRLKASVLPPAQRGIEGVAGGAGESEGAVRGGSNGDESICPPLMALGSSRLDPLQLEASVLPPAQRRV